MLEEIKQQAWDDFLALAQKNQQFMNEFCRLEREKPPHIPVYFSYEFCRLMDTSGDVGLAFRRYYLLEYGKALPHSA